MAKSRQSYNSWSGLTGLPDLPGLPGASYTSGLPTPRVLGSRGYWAPEFNWLQRITVLCLVVSSESEISVFFFLIFLQIELQMYNVG